MLPLKTEGRCREGEDHGQPGSSFDGPVCFGSGEVNAPVSGAEQLVA
jgi:hypothetical protein